MNKAYLNKLRGRSIWIACYCVHMLTLTTPCWAKKGSGMVYENPFDLGSGGASLTRATQASVLFANPALIPYGAGFHRWAGIEPTLIVGKDSVDFAKSMQGNNNSQDASKIVDTVTKTPLHAGATNAISYINKAFGLSVFNRAETDLSAKKYGDVGLPEVNFQADSYHGVALSGASLMSTKMLSFGLTAKYLYAAEQDLSVSVNDKETIDKLSSSDGTKSLVTHNTGPGVDAGMIFFAQGYNLDFKMALKGDDLGGTRLQGNGTLKSLPAMYSVGSAITLHNGVDALHLALDYRDIQGAYKEKTFKRLRAGTKYLFRKYIGLGAGILEGSPSYAAQVDLLLVRLTAAFWTKEMGDSPGVDPRPMYAVGFAMGF